MGRFVVVIGTQWGDEGKGKIVDLLTERASAVARFQGGHNAGHTLVIAGEKTILSLIPSESCVPGPVPDRQWRGDFAGGPVPGGADAPRQGVPVFERLRLSPSCPLILPSHIALDQAREGARGANAIGTTGRGIGPAYEDKVARRAVRVADLFQPERFAAKLGEVLDFHNFVLQRYFNLAAVDFQDTLDAMLVTPIGCGRSCSMSPVRSRACAARGRTCCSKVRRAPCSMWTSAPILRHLIQHHGGRGGDRHRPGAALFRSRARYREGLRDPRGGRTVPDGTVRRVRRAFFARRP